MTDEQPISRRAAREAEKAAGRARLRESAGAEPPDGGHDGAGRGLAAALRAHPVAWLATAGTLAFVMLGTGSIFAGVAWASRDSAQGPTAMTPPPTEAPAVRPVSDQETMASRLRTCSVATQLDDERLVTLVGSVVNAETGELLLDRNGTSAVAPSAVLKALTATIAVDRLGPEFQIATSVYEGSAPGTVVLVGRGDATLSTLPVGEESIYEGAPKLQTLAEDTVAHYRERYPDIPITRVVLDASYWNASDSWDASWDPDERARGTISEVTALQVDGDRDDPRVSDSPRSDDAIGRAGDAFVAALNAADPDGEVVSPEITTTTGTAVDSTELAVVLSQPMSTLVSQMMLTGDNTLAEMIARVISREIGMDGSASSLQQVVPGELSNRDIPQAGVTVRDGSGLSAFDAVPPATMVEVMRVLRAGEDGLEVVRDALGISGMSGTLANRFTGGAADARGAVHGIAGTNSTAASIAGYLDASDGTPLAFSFAAVGDGLQAAGARDALDALTAAVYRCGDNLSNT